MKKVPVSSPYIWAPMPRSLFMVKAANPMLARSRRATLQQRKTNGSNLFWILRMVFDSNSNVTAAMIVAVLRFRSVSLSLYTAHGRQATNPIPQTVFRSDLADGLRFEL